MTSTIRSTRLSRGMSVNELSRQLNVTPSAISQLERSEAEGTIKLNTLREALAAMNANLRMTVGSDGPMSKYAPYRIADSMAEAIASGHQTFALRLLSHALKELEDHSNEFNLAELHIAPTPLPDPRWDTLMRATYAKALSTLPKPAWTQTRRLPDPWFVSQFPALRQRAIETTPQYLRKLNIFIDERSLEHN
jgi:transcriptional regulator with XRE-family HTH domain